MTCLGVIFSQWDLLDDIDAATIPCCHRTFVGDGSLFVDVLTENDDNKKTKGATSGCVREAKQQEAHTMASFAVFRRVNQSRERYCYIMDNGLRANGFKMAERDRCKFCIAPNQLLFWMREYRRIFYGWWSFFPLFLPRSKISSVQNEHIYYAISVTLSKFNSFQLPYLFYLLL